jgi:hypothetical protein
VLEMVRDKAEAEMAERFATALTRHAGKSTHRAGARLDQQTAASVIPLPASMQLSVDI